MDYCRKILLSKDTCYLFTNQLGIQKALQEAQIVNGSTRPAAGSANSKRDTFYLLS
ncbi:hypothetical protein M404DRAFT_1002421 [Pisolithus tinctorius Marx 270]|uniref:Uncharacterized protein n=1 Tax=Pisolithus tinctorius Marx 270 TaxID=870435 RepID=A0A0C3P541_PISTI|nr:hypothetical protein M404DRAFT_1002421 [Pisolithus tinctorius Marx 270]